MPRKSWSLKGISSAALAAALCSGSDWSGAGSDHWQKRERLLSVESVGKLQLVVRRKLGMEPLGAPVMVGRQVTHKGIKDLVFIAGGGTTYAVDPDLGTLFWSRRLDAKGALSLTLGPNGNSDDDDDDDISAGVRALYTMDSGGEIAALNASSGLDLSAKKPARLPAGQPSGGAKWQGADGAWWSARAGIQVFKNGELVWSRPASALSIAVANNVVFVLEEKRLLALDALTGRALFDSESQIDAPVGASKLAIANGHVCFGDTRGTLYCFGFPVDL